MTLDQREWLHLKAWGRARGNSRNSQAMVKTRTKKYKLQYLKSLARTDSCVISPLPPTGDGSTFGSWLAAPRTPRGEAGVRMALTTTSPGGGGLLPCRPRVSGARHLGQYTTVGPIYLHDGSGHPRQPRQSGPQPLLTLEVKKSRHAASAAEGGAVSTTGVLART